MRLSISAIYVFFSMVCMASSLLFASSYLSGGLTFLNMAVGVLGGIVLCSFIIGIDAILKRFGLRSLMTCFLGLFIGSLFTEILFFSLRTAIGSSSLSHQPVHFIIFLVCSFIALTMTVRLENDYRLILPFIEFKQQGTKKKDILVDLSILSDPRFIDFAASGLLDSQLVLPRFAVAEMHNLADSSDEMQKIKARKSLELLKKLETLPSLDLRFSDVDFPEVNDPMTKLIRLARLIDTNIITSDINRIQQSTIEGIKIINIHMLSNALKPLSQAGEVLNIKIQRYGKEPRQGVGYLEDGTMVVVNGGAEFIGETIKAYVLSVKHTSSGRMIFCNASDEGGMPDQASLLSDSEFSISRSYIPT